MKVIEIELSVAIKLHAHLKLQTSRKEYIGDTWRALPLNRSIIFKLSKNGCFYRWRIYSKQVRLESPPVIFKNHFHELPKQSELPLRPTLSKMHVQQSILTQERTLQLYVFMFISEDVYINMIMYILTYIWPEKRLYFNVFTYVSIQLLEDNINFTY